MGSLLGLGAGIRAFPTWNAELPLQGAELGWWELPHRRKWGEKGGIWGSGAVQGGIPELLPVGWDWSLLWIEGWGIQGWIPWGVKHLEQGHKNTFPKSKQREIPWN